MVDVNYCKQFDIFSVTWDNDSEYDSSLELYDGRVVVDVDKNDNVCGFEMFGFTEECKKSKKKINEMFKKWNKQKKKKK